MSATLDGSTSLSTAFSQLLDQAEALNPLLLLSEIASGAFSAAPLGSEDVDGVSVPGYLVSVDLLKAYEAMTGPATPSLLSAIQAQLTALGLGSHAGLRSSKVLIRVWVGSNGLVTQLAASLPGSGMLTTVIALSSVGTVVHVTPPPAAQVVAFASLTPAERNNHGGADLDGS